MVTHRMQITLTWLFVLLMLTACATQAGPQQLSTSQTGAPTRAPTGAPTPGEAVTAYLDDRSSPEVLLSLLCNAINRREYADDYWRTESSDLLSYEAFAEGYSATQVVQVRYGPIMGDAGAGQVRYAVRVALVAQTNSSNRALCRLLHSAPEQPRRAGNSAVSAACNRVGDRPALAGSADGRASGVAMHSPVSQPVITG